MIECINLNHVQTVPIAQIDYTDTRYSIAFPVDVDSLINSFSKIGQLYPIILENGNSFFRVIDGFRRLKAAVAMGLDNIKAVVIDDGKADSIGHYLYHLFSVVSTRVLNEIEKAHVINTLSSGYGISQQDIKNQYASIINLQIFPNYHNTCNLVSVLPDELKLYLWSKNVSLQNLSFLNVANQDTSCKFLNVARGLLLGGNKLKIFFALVEEIAIREKSSILDILSHADIHIITDNTQITITQKWERLFKLLKKYRYPEWSKIEKEMQSEISELMLPPGIKLSYPEYLEGEELRLQASFKNAQELKALAEKILKIADSGTLRKICDRF